MNSKPRRLKSARSSGLPTQGLDTDWAYFGNQLGTLKEVLSKGVSFGNIATYSDFLSERKAFADFASELQNVLSAEAETALSGVSDAFDPKVFDLGKRMDRQPLIS